MEMTLLWKVPPRTAHSCTNMMTPTGMMMMPIALMRRSSERIMSESSFWVSFVASRVSLEI